MKILEGLREDKQLFEYLIESIDKIESPHPKTLDYLSEDLVFMFFADFSSTDKNVSNLLRQFQVIVVKVIKEHAAGNCLTLFENEDLMVNRLIKAFLNNNHNRNYLSLLFGKLFDEATDLKKYARRIKEKNLNQSTNPGSFTLTVAKDKNSEEIKEEVNDILLICEGILNRIMKKLIHMPLAIRYFCKLLEKIVLEHVLAIGNSREERN